MIGVTVDLKDINMVYKFVAEMGKLECDVDLKTQNRRYVVDAKSIMGVLSLDLSEPVILYAYTDDPSMIIHIKNVLMKLFGE